MKKTVIPSQHRMLAWESPDQEGIFPDTGPKAGGIATPVTPVTGPK